MARVEAIRRIIVPPGTSVRIGPDGDTIFRERTWNLRAHVHIGAHSERKTREGVVVRYLEQADAGAKDKVKGLAGIQQEDREKHYPW